MGAILIENATLIPADFTSPCAEPIPHYAEGTALMRRAPGYVLVDGGTIVERGFGRPHGTVRPTEVYDAGGAHLTPGIIEGQCNGLMGCDFSDPQLAPERIVALAPHLHRWGISRLFPTVITSTPERMLRCLANLKVAAEDPQWLQLTRASCHIEGPFLGVPGAHPKDQLRDPDLGEYRQWRELVGGKLLVTLDPTRRGAAEFIRQATADGTTCAMSHTDPVTDRRRTDNRLAELEAAVAAGCGLAIHLGNAYPGTDFNKWHFGYLGWVLANDAMFATLIADGKHLSECVIKLMVRSLGLQRTILWTDMMMATGMPPGEYAISGQQVTVTDAAWLKGKEGKTLAGSIVQPFEAIEFVLRATGLPIDYVWPMVSRNPAAALGHLAGSIRSGQQANLLLFDVVGGRIVLHGHLLDGEWVYHTSRLEAMAR